MRARLVRAKGGTGAAGAAGEGQACWYYVSVARREAISKMEKKYGKKRLRPGCWLADANTAF